MVNSTFYVPEQSDRLDFRILPHLLAYELSVLFSVSRSLREEGNMKISEGVFGNSSKLTCSARHRVYLSVRTCNMFSLSTEYSYTY